MMKLGSGGTQRKVCRATGGLICLPPLRALALVGQASLLFRERLLAGHSRDGVPQEYASLPTKTSLSRTSATTTSRHFRYPPQLASTTTYLHSTPPHGRQTRPRPSLYVCILRYTMLKRPPCRAVQSNLLQALILLSNRPRLGFSPSIPAPLFLCLCISHHDPQTLMEERFISDTTAQDLLWSTGPYTYSRKLVYWTK